MRTLRTILTTVATDPSKLDELTKSISPMLLDTDLDSTFLIAHNLEDVHEVANIMGLVVSDENAAQVLSNLLDKYNPVSGVNLENFKQEIEAVTGLFRLPEA